MTSATKLTKTERAPLTETTEPRGRPPLGSSFAKAGATGRIRRIDSALVVGAGFDAGTAKDIRVAGSTDRLGIAAI
ncbi:hypothetical protein GFS60_08112 (plasmid) [Rhodococcus sp. WAY2]|nr:hypothetical protein GFS60_08112 [Rhodococcus sp. WAY2]